MDHDECIEGGAEFFLHNYLNIIILINNYLTNNKFKNIYYEFYG